ncbi:hypothetical protein SAMN06298216_0730 [Spirosomataceae bacterium TFI 002]|nr:hypothetical protein SAMN06298216_0730 [Spirosomataceae bacterium TFI 002]
MEETLQIYSNTEWIRLFLLCAIYLFVFTSIAMFSFILIARRVKLKKKELDRKFNPVIELILSQNLFESFYYSEFYIYKSYFRNKVFRNQMTESLLNLHENYNGTFAKKLEGFYADSGLIKDSFEKLKSKEWQIKCKGIKELAEMKVTRAFDSFVKLSNSENKTLKNVALSACLEIDINKGMNHLIHYKYNLDLWTQVNILDAIRQTNQTELEGIECLLLSKNTSVVSLGLKAISTLGLSEKASFVLELIDQTNCTKTLIEAKEVVSKLILTNKDNFENDF